MHATYLSLNDQDIPWPMIPSWCQPVGSWKLCCHKHVQHHQAYGRFRVVALVEDAKLKAADHEIEHGQPGMPYGGKLLQ